MRRMLALLVVAAAALAVLVGDAGALLTAVPVLGLFGALAVGRYVGEDTLERLRARRRPPAAARRVSPVARRPVAATFVLCRLLAAARRVLRGPPALTTA